MGLSDGGDEVKSNFSCLFPTFLVQLLQFVVYNTFSMVHTPSINHTHELFGIRGTGDKPENLSEQTPESERFAIIGKTREKVTRFGTVLGFTVALAGAPAMATESPYEPLADTSGKTMLVVKETGGDTLMKSLEQRGFSPAFAQEIARLERENREQRARGEVPNESDYTVSVESVVLIKDAKGMTVLDTEGRSLERADEKALGLPSELSETTIVDTLNRLFEGDESGKSRYSKRITKLQSTPNGTEALATFFRMYNEGKKTLAYPSRESYRHLLIASLSIASFFAETSEKRQGLVPSVVSPVGEFILLTDPKTDTIVHVRIGIPNYLVSPSSSIQNNSILGKLPSVAELQNISDTILGKFRKDEERMVKNGKLQAETAQTKAETAQTKAETAQRKQELMLHTNI